MKVKELKKGDRFYHNFYSECISIKVYWIHRVFKNSYLIDYGTGYMELDGDKIVKTA